MAMLSVFHTQEWLVKYSRTIMDLCRRVIVFIILRLTNGQGRIKQRERRDGTEKGGNEPGNKAKEQRRQGQGEAKSRGLEVEGGLVKRRVQGQ